MDRLKSLAIFKAVVDQGGFARAAMSMNLSSSVVTRSVQELEELLGVRLLLRSTRSVALTSVGESVFERAAELLASYGELEAFSSQSAREPHGVIRMAAPSAYGRCHLGQALATFRQCWPRVAVDLRLRETAADLWNDDADLVLCMGAELRMSVIARELATIEVGLYAAPQLLRSQGVPALPQDLLRYDGLLARNSKFSGWSLVHHDSGQREEVAMRPALQSSHDEVLMEAAVHGAGVVQLPAFMVRAHEVQGSLCRVLPDWHADALTVHLTYESRRHQPLGVRKLIEHLVDWFGAAENPGALESNGPANPDLRRLMPVPLAA